MTVHRAPWDRRCYDCRSFIPAGTEGYMVLDRLLCESCWPEAEHAEEGL